MYESLRRQPYIGISSAIGCPIYRAYSFAGKDVCLRLMDTISAVFRYFL